VNNYKDFEHWFHELENYATRAERCYDDYDIHHNLDRFTNLRRWLEAAFYAGRMQTSYVLTVEGLDSEPYITLPEEFLKAHGWQEGTVLEWTDNNDGSWTLKASKL
jgi:hypothetical protein